MYVPKNGLFENLVGAKNFMLTTHELMLGVLQNAETKTKQEKGGFNDGVHCCVPELLWPSW